MLRRFDAEHKAAAGKGAGKGAGRMSFAWAALPPTLLRAVCSESRKAILVPFAPWLGEPASTVGSEIHVKMKIYPLSSPSAAAFNIFSTTRPSTRIFGATLRSLLDGSAGMLKQTQKWSTNVIDAVLRAASVQI